MTYATDQQDDTARLTATARQMIELREAVLDEWERRARAEIKEAGELRHPIFINTIPTFYENLAQAISPAYPRLSAISSSSIAAEHGGERARLTRYNLDLLIREYQILRTVITDVLAKNGVALTTVEAEIITESIDEAIRESASAFALAIANIREQFIATLTHDMRTPLNVASLSAQLIQQASDSPRVQQLAGSIVETHRRLDEMIQNLLDTVVHRGKHEQALNVIQFDIREVVDEVVGHLRETDGDRYAIKGLRSLTGWWDRGAIMRALENMLGNARKYGEPSGDIVIRLEEAHEQLILSVHNAGPSIPAEEQEAIFQPFRRATAAREGRHAGWGLGLSYVRSVAERHGGSVLVDSSGERGTTFLLDMPVDCRPYREAPTLA